MIKLPNNKNLTVILNDVLLAPVFAAGLTPPFAYVAYDTDYANHAREIFGNCGLVLGQDAHVVSQQELETRVPVMPASLCMCVANKISLKAFTDKLSSFGYARMSKIENEGEFSIRGDIVDIWQPSSPHPVRVMFCDVVIESIKLVDINGFKSIKSLEKCQIAPIPGVCEITEWRTMLDVLHALTKTFIRETDNGFTVDCGAKTKATVTINTAPVGNYFSALSILVPEILWNVNTRGKTVFVFVGASRACEKYMESKGVPYTVSTPDNFTAGAINIVRQSLGVSFELVDQGLVFYCVTSPKSAPSPETDPYEAEHGEFFLPTVGDLVIHETHGLGRYLGIKTMELAGTIREYVVLQYDGGAFVYLPPDRTHELVNYFGPPRRLSRI